MVESSPELTKLVFGVPPSPLATNDRSPPSASTALTALVRTHRRDPRDSRRSRARSLRSTAAQINPQVLLVMPMRENR
jgi:hypothetical protein